MLHGFVDIPLAGSLPPNLFTVSGRRRGISSVCLELCLLKWFDNNRIDHLYENLPEGLIGLFLVP